MIAHVRPHDREPIPALLQVGLIEPTDEADDNAGQHSNQVALQSGRSSLCGRDISEPRLLTRLRLLLADLLSLAAPGAGHNEGTLLFAELVRAPREPILRHDQRSPA